MTKSNSNNFFQSHFESIFAYYEEEGPIKLGPINTYAYFNDAKHVLFSLARYKFCAKMLAGKKKVMEIGCGDSFGLPIVLQSVGAITGYDLEPNIIEENRKLFKRFDRVAFEQCDFVKNDSSERFDGGYSLDVIEHIEKDLEHHFMANICRSLTSNSVFILGTPNKESEKHASPKSKESHVNVKSANTLKELMQEYFANVFLFSMNDEVVHTGYYPMAHYLIALGVGLRN